MAEASTSKSDRDQTHHRPFMYFISVLAAICGLLFGVDTGVISGALLFLKDEFHLSSFMQEVVTSSVLVGAVIGAATSGTITDKIGRRLSVIITAIIFLVGAVAVALAPFVWWLIIARGVVGFAIGVASYIGPLYIAEVAPPKIRGMLVSLNQLAITSGILVAYLIDLAFAPAGLWRWMFAIHAVPAAALLIGMFFAPDSPRFLYAQGKKEEARDVLKRIRPAGTAEEELRDIEADVSTESKNWKELLRPAIRPALMVGIGLAIFQQVTGINTIIYYAPTIFQFTGISSNTSSILATVVVGVVNVLLTIVALFLIDRIGRRPLLLGGLVGMVLSLVGLGVAFLFPNLGALSWIALACLVVYVGSFAIGLGPVFWLLISEIYPTSLRGRASSVATVANWAANLVVTLTFLTLIDLLGKSGTFWLYGLIGIGCWVFTYYLVPETKGRTLEEIQEKWEKDSQPAERPLKPGRGAMPEG